VRVIAKEKRIERETAGVVVVLQEKEAKKAIKRIGRCFQKEVARKGGQCARHALMPRTGTAISERVY